MSRARLFETIIDAGGRPVVGASVAVYQPGTATPIAETLYADDTGGTTAANPLLSGADGSVLAYLDAPRRVDLYITAVGMTPRTVPDVGLFPDPADFTTDTDLGNHTGAGNPHPAYALDTDLTAHEAAANPHAVYALDTDLTTHAGAADPHTVYQKESERGAANGYAPLGAGSLVPIANLATGTPDGTKFVRDDGTLVLPAGSTPTTTRGDLIYRNATVDARLAIGTIGQRLTVVDIGSGVLEPRYEAKQSGMAIGSTSGPTTTSTTYVDLTDMSVTVTVGSGGILLAWFEGSFQNNSLGQAPFCGFSLDGAAEVGVNAVNAPVANYSFALGLCYRWSGVAAGSHTIKVRWKVSGGTGTAPGTSRVLLVMEG